MPMFEIKSKFQPMGDQPQAIDKLAAGLSQGLRNQVLLGVTGSGKTFTMANIIKKAQRPALIIAHNKTLAAQLAGEFKEFFPDSAVGYFVSYYDYYQPEAYIPASDTYIEKDSAVNEEIDRMRHSATAWLEERRDVIIVASVSCIYGLGDPKEYTGLSVSLREGEEFGHDELLDRLVEMQYTRNDFESARCTFRVKGDIVEIVPPNSDKTCIRVEFFGDDVDAISEVDTTTGKALRRLSHVMLYPASHYATSREHLEQSLVEIEKDLQTQLQAFNDNGRLLEAQRLEQRTNYDIEMLREIGFCQGIENYSRYFEGRAEGTPPFTLMDYFPEDFIVFIDESHVTIPQIRAMYNGDRARKETLVEYGFRLPAAFDNRPLKFHEFEDRVHQVIYVSATPGPYELQCSQQTVEQLIRPTGLIDPEIIVRPGTRQVDDLLGEIRIAVKNKQRVLVTTLTKKMAESLTAYLKELDIKVEYLHSDVDTLDRIRLIRSLRLGEFDVLVGINLLREGLDIPETGLVAILDADKEGFLRSETSLVQTMGRAARNVSGKVIMYADTMTDSMTRAINETNRRRQIQQAYNTEHNITPRSVSSVVHELLEISHPVSESGSGTEFSDEEKEATIARLEESMLEAAEHLDFEKAAKLRDQLLELKGEAPMKSNEQSRKTRRKRK